MHNSSDCIEYYIRTAGANLLYLTAFRPNLSQQSLKPNSPVGSLLPALTPVKECRMSFDSLCEAKAVFGLFSDNVDLSYYSGVVGHRFCLCMYDKLNKTELGVIARTA